MPQSSDWQVNDVVATTERDLRRLDELAERLARDVGLDYPARRRSELQHKIARLSRSLGISDTAECVDWLLANWSQPKILDRLISVCTVGETYFLREPESLRLFIERALPPLIRRWASNGRPVKIWSAGCCTGEEPYSIALALSEFGFRNGSFDFEVFGTDINREFLQRAREGRYGRWSFRSSPDWFRRRYFREDNAGFWVLERAARLQVRFERINLTSPEAQTFAQSHGPFDAIFCRNVLMYFTQYAADRAMQTFRLGLDPLGWIVTSPTESSILHAAGFVQNGLPPNIALNKARTASKPTDPEPECNAPLLPATVESDWLDAALRQSETEASVDTASVVDVQAAIHTKAIESFEDRIEEAERLMNSGLIPEALEALCEFPKLCDCADAQFVLARLYYLDGAYADALECCRKVREVDVLDWRAHHLTGLVLRERGAADEAIDWYKRALYLVPDSPVVQMDLAFAYRELGRPELGRRHFRNAADLFALRSPGELLSELGNMTAGHMAAIATTLASEGSPR